MKEILQLIEVVISLFLILVVLLQQRGASLGGAFGSEGFAYKSRRGAERFLYQATIVLAVIFVALAIAILILARG